MFREAEVKLIGDNLIRIDKIKVRLDRDDIISRTLSLPLYDTEDNLVHRNVGRCAVKSVDYLKGVAECYVDLDDEGYQMLVEKFKEYGYLFTTASSEYTIKDYNLITKCFLIGRRNSMFVFTEIPMEDLIKSVERLRRHNEMYLRKRWDERIHAVETLRNNLDKI